LRPANGCAGLDSVEPSLPRLVPSGVHPRDGRGRFLAIDLSPLSALAAEAYAMKVTVLGCGGSGGVPLIGGNWGRCNPDNPKNRRRRVPVLVEHAGHNIVPDTPRAVRT